MAALVPPAFRASPRWARDEAGRAWLDSLPALVAAACTRWGLAVDGGARHGSNALVVPVLRGRERLALRLTPPGDGVAAEIGALRFWDGRGTVLLRDADAARGITLLERLDGDRSLAGEPLAVALPVLAELTRELAVPAPLDVPTTAEVAAEMLASFERDWAALTAIGQPGDPRHLSAALGYAQDRASADPGPGAVDGDLHGDQVLAGTRAPWLVVDPVLLRGDREADLARVLWTRADELPTARDLREAAALFARVADVPPERARAWIVLRATSYLLWGLANGLTEDPPRCRRLLEAFV